LLSRSKKERWPRFFVSPRHAVSSYGCIYGCISEKVERERAWKRPRFFAVMKTLLVVFVLPLAATLRVGVADVGRVRADADAFFKTVDEDADGFISFAELSGHLEKKGYHFGAREHVFDLLDVNRDGEICAEELRAAFVQYDELRSVLGLGEDEVEWRKMLLFNSIDTDNSGEISREEFTAYIVASGYTADAAESIFDVLDDDADGTISRDELHQGYISYSTLRTMLGLPLEPPASA